MALVMASAAILCAPALAQRIGPAAAVPTIEAGSCDLELRPPQPLPKAPSFLVVSYKPGADAAAVTAEVITPSGSVDFDQDVLRRLRTCAFTFAAGPQRGATGLLLMPVREGLGVRRPDLLPGSPLPTCAPIEDDYPNRARRENRSGSVRVKVVGTQAGHLARIELSVSSGQLDFDEAALARAANCTRLGAKPGASEWAFHRSL